MCAVVCQELADDCEDELEHEGGSIMSAAAAVFDVGVSVTVTLSM